jgi:hypothetical protein
MVEENGGNSPGSLGHQIPQKIKVSGDAKTLIPLSNAT